MEPWKRRGFKTDSEPRNSTFQVYDTHRTELAAVSRTRVYREHGGGGPREPILYYIRQQPGRVEAFSDEFLRAKRQAVIHNAKPEFSRAVQVQS